MNENQVLLVIDAQINMFSEESSVYKAKQMIKILQQLVKEARLKGVPVIWVRNNGGKGDPDEPRTRGWKIHPSLRPKEGEILIDKYKSSAFKDTNLIMILEQMKISHLIIAGMQTEFCINSTVRNAIELGFNVTLIKDGHSTFDSEEMKASDIIKKYNEELDDIVKIDKAENIRFQKNTF